MKPCKMTYGVFPFVIVNISQADIERLGGWPLTRQQLADIHIDLLNEGAIGVGYGMVFPFKSRTGGDEIFAQALSYGPSVLAMYENGSGHYPKTTSTVIKGENICKSGIFSPLKIYEKRRGAS